jgi:adenylate kinase family enzyme
VKKLILICGANGVGKSTVSRALLEAVERSACIDSEYCCAIHPFELTADTIQLFRANITALMINCFCSATIQTVIFPYGFHGPRREIYQGVLDELREQGIRYEFCPVILECEYNENVDRMRKDKRTEDRIQRALKQTRHIYDHYDYPRIDTTHLSVSETVEEIIRMHIVV